jgi:hypothetical protein
MTHRRYLLLVVAVLAAWWLLRPASSAAWAGRPAPHEPRQTTAGLPAAWRDGDFAFQPLARFDCQAVVLSRRNYRSGRAAELCRTDFAVGWGAMSEAEVINRMKITQDMRWFFFEWRGELPVPAEQVLHAAANMHLIPANDEVRAELARVRRHDLMRFSGYLVEITHPEGWKWTSSTSRTDTGGGACEVVWVERVEHAAVPR